MRADGDLVFDPIKFPEPKGMVERLASLGFSATLWVTPFAELGSEAYAEGRSLGHWMMASADGEATDAADHARGGYEPALVTWWQGQGVMLNVTSVTALAWFEKRLRRLIDETVRERTPSRLHRQHASTPLLCHAHRCRCAHLAAGRLGLQV